RITPAACASVMRPALTKLTTITVVADEERLIALTNAPAATASNSWSPTPPMIRRSRSPARACNASDIVLMPKSSKPKPPIRLSQTVMSRAPQRGVAASSSQSARQAVQHVAEDACEDRAGGAAETRNARIELATPSHQRAAAARIEHHLAAVIADWHRAPHDAVGHAARAIEAQHFFVDLDAEIGDLAHAANAVRRRDAGAFEPHAADPCPIRPRHVVRVAIPHRLDGRRDELLHLDLLHASPSIAARPRSCMTVHHAH